MLNISHHRIDQRIEQDKLKSLNQISAPRLARSLAYWIIGFFVLFVGLMFAPWTQNILSRGKLTGLNPAQRPQTVHATIPGRIENWYVSEGDYVNKGDTIIFLSEVKEKYFDPELLERTQEQISAKESSITSYKQKAEALARQIQAYRRSMTLKIEQSKNKVMQYEFKLQSDSMSLEATKTDYKIAQAQFARMEQLYEEDLKSLTDYEKRKAKLQSTMSKQASAENKFLSSKNELINAQIELNNVQNDYLTKIAKAESDRSSALSAVFDAEASLAKMRNQYSNLSIRAGFYYITAPQSGYIVKALKAGLGETIKEGSSVVSIMPDDFDLAVELYVAPMDLPLLEVGNEVRIQFDGWPAIIFSGWPNTSFGTFSGRVFAIDRMISDNGKFRVLVEQNPDEQAWPEQLKVGAGALGIALLKEVPVWYELWRQLNGFPPDFYHTEKNGSVLDKKEKPKAPVKNLK